MKRKDSALNLDRRRAPLLPAAQVCGAPNQDGTSCGHTVLPGGRCPVHGAPDAPAQPVLPEGVCIPKSFAQEDRQRALEQFVADCLKTYDLNDAADLRQTLLSGIAFVRLQYDGSTMKPQEVDMLSRVVDRHLRNLRATPKEQAAGKTPGGGVPVAPGMAPAAILERVRLALTPGQVAAMVAGQRPSIGQARLVDGGAGLLPVAGEEIFQEPRRAQPDPFAALDGPEDGDMAPLDPAIDPFGD